MNSKDDSLSAGGAEAASEASEADESLQENFDTAEMKRTAAKKLIERYYYQILDGCGNSSCTNEFCASSGKMQIKSPNQAAAQALLLFQNNARLCEHNPAKVAKLPTQRTDEPSVATAMTRATSTLNNLTMNNLEPSVSSASVNKVPLPEIASVNTSDSSLVLPNSTNPSETSNLVFSEPSTSSSAKKAGKQDPLYLTESRVKEIISICIEENTYSLLIRTLGQVYSNAEGLIKSFRLERIVPHLDTWTKEDIRAIEEDQDKDLDSKEEKSLERPNVTLKPDEITVDLESLRRAYDALFAIPKLPFQGALINALLILYENAELDLRYHNIYDQDPNYLNIFIIVLEIPTLGNDEFWETVLHSFCKAAAFLPISGQGKLARIIVKHQSHKLKDYVHMLHQFITVKVMFGQTVPNYCVNDDDAVIAATKFMKILFYAAVYGGQSDHAMLIAEENEQNEAEDNLQDLLQGAVGRENKEPKAVKEDPLGVELGVRVINCRKPLIPFEEFYNELLNDHIAVDKDFANYKADADRSKFSFMNYSFILTPATKSLGLYYDNRVRMYNERRISVYQSFLHGDPPNPYLRLRVRRDHIIDDALIELEMIAMENPSDLKKQLVVEFEGEQCIDEGGVSKEFFQLVVEELFKPDFAMFTLNTETQMYWFNPTSFESDGQFTLIGIVLGLAIYNNINLDVHFPHVVYRKLLGKKGVFEDLADWDPSLFQGLTELLQYKGDDIEETFLQTFRISYKDVFGTHLTYDLKENGEQILVNHDSKAEFVDLYANFLLNKCIEKQFRAFKRGFQLVTDESPLKWLCRPEEVELLVCGSQVFDFNALEDSTEYDGGYTSQSSVIKYFWEIVHDLSEEEKSKLLQFTTGSNRAPVGGLSKLKLVIAKNGPDSNRLPTAHTCFNVLLLPEYSSKEKLRERLLKAINYSKGFGML